MVILLLVEEETPVRAVARTNQMDPTLWKERHLLNHIWIKHLTICFPPFFPTWSETCIHEFWILKVYGMVEPKFWILKVYQMVEPKTVLNIIWICFVAKMYACWSFLINSAWYQNFNFVFSGIALLKVGGRMVYSTCSMNPVENEAVVAEVFVWF